MSNLMMVFLVDIGTINYNVIVSSSVEKKTAAHYIKVNKITIKTAGGKYPLQDV